MSHFTTVHEIEREKEITEKNDPVNRYEPFPLLGIRKPLVVGHGDYATNATDASVLRKQFQEWFQISEQRDTPANEEGGVRFPDIMEIGGVGKRPELPLITGHLPTSAPHRRYFTQPNQDQAGSPSDSWMCPISGEHMRTEQRRTFLLASADYRLCWEAAFMRLTDAFRRVHLQRRSLHVHRSGLCSYIEAFCALADTEGDEISAVTKCMKEAYRHELKLAAEVIGGAIQAWLNKPMVGARRRKCLDR